MWKNIVYMKAGWLKPAIFQLRWLHCYDVEGVIVYEVWAFLCQNPGYSPGLISTYRTYRRSVKLTCLEELWGRTLSIYKQRFMDFSLATKSLSPPMMASCSALSGLEAKDSFIRNHSQTKHSLCFDDCCLTYACRTCVFGPHHSSS